VVSRGAGGGDPNIRTFILQRFDDYLGSVLNLVKVVSLGVEIDNGSVRFVELVPATQPGVKGQAALVDQIEEGFQIVAADETLSFTGAFLFYLHGIDPRGEVVRNLFLIESGAFNSVGEAL
jgi:hypothetical protein